MILDLRSATQRHAFYRGKYDETLLDSFLRLVEADSVVLDVGANIGFYSIPIAMRLLELGGTGKVFAFEPLAQNMARLGENAELNAVTSYIEMCPFGLSSQITRANLVLRGEFTAGSTTGNASIGISEHWDSGLDNVSAPLETLDSLLAEGRFDRVDVIKLDIEGHEDHFFAGGARALRETRPVILMEVNKPYYRARGLWNVDSVFSRAIPERYLKLRLVSGQWERVVNLNECPELADVFLVPEEKELPWRERMGWPLAETRSV
jgi:FkbM family methyltransferase